MATDTHTILPFIVSKPYEIKVLEHPLKVYRIAFMLDDGEKLWEEDANIKDVLSTNDLFPKMIKKEKDGCALVAIDLEKTKLGDFFFYDDPESPSEGLMWRTFFYFQDTSTQKNFIDSWKYPKMVAKYIDSALKIWNDIYT